MSKEWKLTGIREYPGGKREYKIFGELCEIATIPIVSGSDGTDEFNRANLFIAAPNLLEACKRIHDYFMGTGGDPLRVDQVVEKAIAKAEGK